MVGRVVVLAAALFAASSCRPATVSCGRGRCQTGSCIQVLETYSETSELSLDWWCVVPCSGALGCATDRCLQSPIASSVQVCAGDTLEVKYTVPAEAKVQGADGLKAVQGIDIELGDGGTVRCGVNQICSAGWFKSGEFLPDVYIRVSGGGPRVRGPNGTPAESYPDSPTAGPEGRRAPLGKLLPTGLSIPIKIGGRLEPFE